MNDDLLTPLAPAPQPDLAPLARAGDLMLLLDRWLERGWLRALDKAFVGFLHELEPDGDPLVLMAAALTSHQLGHGHVCLDLFETLKEPDFALSLPPKATCRAVRCCRPTCWPASTALTGARPWRPVAWWHWRPMVPRRLGSGRWCCRASACTCVATGPMSAVSTWPCASAWRSRNRRLRTWPNA